MRTLPIAPVLNDIFISYSRKDSEQALMLAEALRSEGISIWIDQHGIIGAEHWGAEIADSIKNSGIVLVLLSPNSVESENVLREVMLAVDKQKRILPVLLKEATLPSAFDYAFAGLQYLPYADLSGIIRAYKHGAARIARANNRLSLMILPFEDLSPSQDNSWFADGLTGELISALSSVKSLRVMDRMTSMSLKNYNGRTTTLAQELDVQYFLEGSVRKVGDQIKINVELLDISTGDYLWHFSERGSMDDIFDFQEAVAEKVVEGLRIHLTKTEDAGLRGLATNNAEAFELAMKANEFFQRHTLEGLKYSIDLYRQSIECDPLYSHAMQALAFMLADYYRVYARDPELLKEAEMWAKRAIETNVKEAAAFRALCMIYRLQGKLEEAEDQALRYVRRAPESYVAHFALGLHYASTKQPDRAIAPYQEALKLNPDDLDTHWNLAIVQQRCGLSADLKLTARSAIDRFSRHMRLHPDDESRRVQLATLMFMIGEREPAIEALKPLESKADLDAATLYNIACLSSQLDDAPAAIRYLDRSAAAGFKNLEVISHDKDLDPLRRLPEFEAIIERMAVESAPVSV